MKKRVLILTSMILLLGILLSYGAPISILASETETTAELLEDVLNHSNIWMVPLFDSPELFLEWIKPDCPSITEFLSRTDCIQAIANKCNLLLEQEGNYSLIQKCQIDVLTGLENIILESNSNGRLSYTYTETSVYTCKGNPVSAQIRTNCIYTAADLAAIQNNLDEYDSTVALRSYSPYYNCHSYAWYSTAASNPYWIGEPQAFLNDGTYVQTSWGIGDIIVYRSNGNVTHSGIITAKSGNSLSQITVVSKWGAAALYQHRGDDCPYAEYANCTVTVYRLCVHSESNYTIQSTSTALHTISCPTCGFLKHEAHTLNAANICTICGGKGSSLEFNSITLEELQ
ncbi:MAG: hypothetical protein IKC63_01170 [Clostridia bacterium]|nr:hypothetical protein [Clostridia bacterium]